MDQTTLNAYIGRAKRISQTISWIALRNEMREAGASPDEILHVARFLNKGSAKRASFHNPVQPMYLPQRENPVLLCGYRDADVDFMKYDPVNRVMLVSRRFLNG